MTYTVKTKGLAKSFGEHHALRGVDLAIEEGTVFALLGPNGAGKTTMVRILATLLRPDAGTAEQLGTAAGPQYRLVNGVMTLDEDATNEAAERAAAAESTANADAVVEEENDLTIRLNRMTGINNRRRDPRERVRATSSGCC